MFQKYLTSSRLASYLDRTSKLLPWSNLFTGFHWNLVALFDTWLNSNQSQQDYWFKLKFLLARKALKMSTDRLLLFLVMKWNSKITNYHKIALEISILINMWCHLFLP